jgi:hypothetical protein
VPGEDPEDFRPHLALYLRPIDARSRVIVETRAETWRDKNTSAGWAVPVRCDTLGSLRQLRAKRGLSDGGIGKGSTNSRRCWERPVRTVEVRIRLESWVRT